MTGGTGIEWTDETWNPVVGCSKTSPGCDNCYAIPQAVRIQRMGGKGGATYEGTTKDDGPDWSGVVKCLPARLGQPLRWRRPRRIFVNSMSDLFHPGVPEEFIAEVFTVMARANHHTYQILTKRPQRMANVVNRLEWIHGDPAPFADGPKFRVRPELVWNERTILEDWPHVWLGTSIESDRYSFRADWLRKTQCAVRWISAEPLLGPLTSLDLTNIDWLVVGGESGKNARPMHPDWVRDLRDRPAVCKACEGTGSILVKEGGVTMGGMACECNYAPVEPPAFFFKQWGEWAECELDVEEVMRDQEHQLHGCQFMNNADGGSSDHFTGGVYMRRRSKRATGRDLDDRTWNEYPIVTP